MNSATETIRGKRNLLLEKAAWVELLQHARSACEAQKPYYG